jgi:tRNA 2-selenouridine synthase
LNNSERHLVGKAYKEEGQEAAVVLGHRLVDPVRATRVAGWREYFSHQTEEPVLTCFRGGLRSQTAQAWLADSGLEVARVLGGYKALRRELFRELSLPFAGFVITGLTGSDKTGFLKSLKTPRAICLESLAVHRGSAFGGLFQPSPQPAQQTFENALALELLRNRDPKGIVLEDESRLVGQCVLPGPFFEMMRTLPRIFLECSDEDRAAHIFEVYVAGPQRKFSPQKVESDLLSALRSLKNRLGGLAAQEIERDLLAAFRSGTEEDHHLWILRLLNDYYDRLYRHAMARHPQEPVFRGNAEACREFLFAKSRLI